MRPRWNFILITALSRNRTPVTEVKGTCANHRTTNTPKSRTNFTQFYNRLILQWIVCLWGWNIVSVMASNCHLRCVIAMCHDSRDFLMRKSWSFVNHASVFEVDDVVVFPCMICNVGALCVFCCVPNVFFSSGVKWSSRSSSVGPRALLAGYILYITPVCCSVGSFYFSILFIRIIVRGGLAHRKVTGKLNERGDWPNVLRGNSGHSPGNVWNFFCILRVLIILSAISLSAYLSFLWLTTFIRQYIIH